MKKLILMLAAGSLILFNSCTKTGPQGPVGPQGPTGPTGPAGQNGNANVIGSGKTFTVNNWQYSTTNNYYYASFSDPDITSDVVDGGIVEMFRLYTSNNHWANLPDINGNTSIVFDFGLNAFTIYVQALDGSVPANPGSITFRDVVITPSQRQANPNTDWKNYNQVMKVVNATQSSSVQ
jgi:hypothetical protein